MSLPQAGDPLSTRASAIDALGYCRTRIEEHLPQVVAKRFEITYKADGSPVTTADHLLEQWIRGWLTEKLGPIQFIGEESYQGGWAADDCWVAVVDPIDGTENFCSGLREWGVAISLWRQGKHAGSALLLPEMRDGLISGDTCPVYTSRITAFSSSYSEAIARGLAEATEYRVFGCAVYNLLNVIRGSVARFVNPKGAYSWDLLAGVALAMENGCRVNIDGSQYDGQFLEPNQRYRVDIHHR
jgi:myo-inositol-1(or 4)-monophosphatase